ncbi:zinc finger protein ZFP2-like [Syngnathoides biaculeatus]|uniref:zinc finger protein ZFP2-like n=1 Tax=Syngnathoides biaculeatus TaxID=300417 RepID=UPI002ADD4E83|nr:zinc finger protein ZFP2-like [Syngnathoides biaculeatus]
MTSYQYIRHFVNERLAAAAEEIAGVFINTIVEYEEEIGRQRRLLDDFQKPRIKLDRREHQEQDVDEQQAVFSGSSWSSEDRENPEPPQIKEEPCTSHDGDEWEMKQEWDNIRLISVCQESHTRDNHAPDSSECLNHFEEWHCDKNAVLHNTDADKSQQVKTAEDGDLRSKTFVEGEIKQKLDKNSSHDLQQQDAHKQQEGLTRSSWSDVDEEVFEPRQVKEEPCTSQEEEGLEIKHKMDTCMHLPISQGSSHKDDGIVSAMLTNAEPTIKHGRHSQNPRTRIHKGEKRCICSMCGKRFYNKTTLKLHIMSHTGEKPYACDICGNRFTVIAMLNRHKKIHTGDKPYPCGHCEKRFSDKTALRVHMRTHTGEKPYPCDVCEKRLSSATALKVHMRTHTGEKPFCCNTCGGTFRAKTALKSHMRIHTGDKPYTCDFCDKRLSSTTALKVHLRTHTGEKPYPCDMCQKRLSSTTALKIHMRTHTGEKPFSCNICGSRFRAKATLKIHMRIHG